MPWGEDDGREIRKAFQRRSETRDALVLVVSGSQYVLEDCTTGGQFEAEVLQGGVTYPVGKRVTVRHNAGGRAQGQKPQIMGASQADGNGTIVGTLAYSVTRSAATITQLPALPVLLVKGGQPVVVTVYGVRLSGAATYGTANITDSVAQSLTDQALILRPQATGACAPGRYSFTFAGQTVPNFFEVTA